VQTAFEQLPPAVQAVHDPPLHTMLEPAAPHVIPLGCM
jgi:hypothetical protein